ncbi:MAG: hypothetical protein ABI643_01985 [Candidatus Doudnabacteria bacterium]
MEDQILDAQTREELPVDIAAPANAPGSESGWKRFFKNKKIIIPSAVAIVLLAGIAGYFLTHKAAAPNPTSTNVLLTVKGPDQLTSGNEAEYHIVYLNGENADLVGISMEVFYPTGFQFKSSTPTATTSSGQTFNLPVLKQGQRFEVVIRGKLSGSTGEDKEIKARLHYRLSNFNSEFLVEQSVHTGILPPNLTMDINGPVDVVNGQDTTFTVNFTNVSPQDFDNLAIQLTYPEGFTFTSSSPLPAKNKNYWTIPKVASASSSSISITGNFSGDPTADKLVRADLGQIINNNFALQISSTATFKIIPSSLALAVSAQPDNFVKLGDTVNYKLKYTNQGSIGLSNLVVVLTLDGPALDFVRLNTQNGIVTGNTLTWKAATTSALAALSPNETGEIVVSVPVKDNLTTNLKNQTITAKAIISSDEITQPTKADPIVLKLISGMDLTVDGSYSSGALPMTVGQSTLFDITFTLSNLSNDLSGTIVTASLPLPPTAWKNVVLPDSEKQRLTYDPNSGKITWRIETLPAFTGRFIPALRVTFQIEVTPTESNRGNTVNLLSDVQATGTDSFVNQPIQTQNISTISTSTINDDVLNAKGTTVQ